MIDTPQGMRDAMPKLPETPSGCFWYFIGFILFVVAVVTIKQWMF
jgi:hypothetical protein